MRVGFVGVGSMGLPMLERVVAAGFEVSFFARRPEVVAQVESLGARPAGSLSELAAGTDILVICVFTDDQVREVCLGEVGVLSALRGGSVIVLHTTCSPSTPIELAELGSAQGVRVVDAAFSGGPADAAAATVTVLAGGDIDAIDKARPVLACYAEPILHVGDLGDGQRVKLLNNALFGANVGLVVEAERVAKELGLDPAKAFEAISHCSGHSYALGVAQGIGSAQQLLEVAGRYIDKDVATAQALAAECGAELGLLATAAGGASSPAMPSLKA